MSKMMVDVKVYIHSLTWLRAKEAYDFQLRQFIYRRTLKPSILKYFRRDEHDFPLSQEHNTWRTQ